MRHLYPPAARADHKYCAEFWIVNATRRQVLAAGRQCGLIIHQLQKWGSALWLVAAGSLDWWFDFMFQLHIQEAVLVRSATPKPEPKRLRLAFI